MFSDNCYDKFETCINDSINLFKNYLKNLLENKYVSSNLLVKEIKILFSSVFSKEPWLDDWS